jgi:predicted transcriptional regulator
MTKNVAAYSEILYHLINFRTDQFQQLKKMLGIDYDSFMILSVMGSHYLKHRDKLGSDWEAVWKNLRTSTIEEFYIARKLTIYAVANILNLPKETVRRKVEILKKKKLISHSTKMGLLPTNKTEEIMKSFAEIELKTLSKFLKNLKKNNTLDEVLNF